MRDHCLVWFPVSGTCEVGSLGVIETLESFSCSLGLGHPSKNDRFGMDSDSE